MHLERIEQGRGQEWWDRWLLGMAQYVSTASKDPSTRVGSVLIDANRRPVSWGYNGFPQHIADTHDRYANREQKYKMIVHAEANALLFGNQRPVGCTIYVWPFMPCTNCTSLLIQSGIKRVVSITNDPTDEKLLRWKSDFDLSVEMLREASVELVLYDP